MPRTPRDSTPQRRARCEHACDNCKRRKERCNGARPCAICTRRRAACVYSELPARVLQQNPSSNPSPFRLGDILDPNDAENPSNRALDRPTPTHRRGEQEQPVSEMQLEAPVPRVARMLRDGRGKFIYIGDSASLSFIQNVRRIALSTIGECPLTTDRLRHSILELPPPDEDAKLAQSRAPRPSTEEARVLADQYLAATACLLDLFDPTEMVSGLLEWIQDPSADDKLSSSIFYLILAIGAQVTAENGNDESAHLYFATGRQLAFSSFTQEPSIQTVQSYALIAMYLLGACRRNASFMNLGIAVRAAYALGLHRNDILDLFSETERRSRERIWQTIRVLDLFLSASLGRPPATSDFEKDPTAESNIPTPSHDNVSDEMRFSDSVVNLCSIFERILIEVYKKRSVSTLVADDISRQYRTWTARLPSKDYRSVSEMASSIAAAHLHGAYHWSIILLTRPFLVFYVSLHQQRNSPDKVSLLRSASSNGNGISNFADACVDSAIKGIDIAETLINQSNLPRRLPFVVNSVFNSALAIGLAFFGDYDRAFPLTESMAGAERILRFMSTHDPLARRYSQILGYLSSAAQEYVQRRDRKSTQQRSSRVSSIFGTIQDPSLQTQSTASLPQEPNGMGAPSPTASKCFPSPPENDGQTHTLAEYYQTANWPRQAADGQDIDHPTLTVSGLLISRPVSRQGPRPPDGAHQLTWQQQPNGEFTDPFMLDMGSDAELMPMFNVFDGLDSIDWLNE